VWDLLDDETAFTKYVQDEVRGYLDPQGKAKRIMNNIGRIVVVVLLAGTVGAVIAVKKSREAPPRFLRPRREGRCGSIENAVKPPEEPKALPRLLELGSDKCIPCKDDGADPRRTSRKEYERPIAGVVHRRVAESRGGRSVWRAGDPDADIP